MTRRRVVSVVTSDRRRGAEVQGERIAAALRVRGWEVDLVALCGSGRGPRVDAEVLAATCRRFDPRLVRRLRSLVRDRGAGAVIANGSATLRYSVAALFGMKPRPALVHVSIGEPSYWVRSRLHGLVQRWLLRRVDAIVAVSEVTARQLRDVYGVDPGRIEVIYSGMPSDLLDLAPAPPADHLRLLFVGSLSREKDPVGAVEIVSRLDFPVQLRMVGDGPLREATESEAAARGMGDRLQIVTAAQDIASHLQWADILVITSRTEGLPGVALEAAGAGVPTVAYAVGGLSEAVVDRRTGLLVTPGDVADFVAALKMLAADPDRRGEMGQAGRELFRERFLLDRAAAGYEALLLDLIG